MGNTMQNTSLMRTFLVVLALSLPTATISAFQTQRTQRPRQEQSPRRGQSPANREEVEGLMDAYVISKLQTALELDDEQFAKMVVAQKKLQEHRRTNRRQRMETLAKLRRNMEGPDLDDRQIAELLERLQQIQAEFDEQQRADYQVIDGILTLHQRARYRLLEVELDRRMQELFRQIRRQRGQRQSDPRMP